ncbi:hypothetical protein Bhyg_07692, partial [Pseudolycoriella hygida]
MEWHRTKGIEENDFSEKVMLVYLDHLHNKYAPSSIWCFYSIQCNHNVPKNSNVLEGPDINRFWTKASDLDHFATKVILVLGIYGTTRADELTKLVLKDIEVQGAVYLVKIPDTKNKLPRSFTIEQEYAAFV